MSERYEVRYESGMGGFAGVVIDTTDGREVCWETDAPEDATFARAFAPLVDECNRLAAALTTETATREALRTQESRIMAVLADAGVPVGDVVAGVEWVVEALSNAHAALDAYEEIDRVVDDESGQPLTLSVAQRISALITLADGAANEASVLAEELASERAAREEAERVVRAELPAAWREDLASLQSSLERETARADRAEALLANAHAAIGSRHSHGPAGDAACIIDTIASLKEASAMNSAAEDAANERADRAEASLSRAIRYVDGDDVEDVMDALKKGANDAITHETTLKLMNEAQASLEQMRRERDEARANFLRCAEAIGVVYEADGRATKPGPVEEVECYIREAVRRGDRAIDADVARREAALREDVEAECDGRIGAGVRVDVTAEHGAITPADVAHVTTTAIRAVGGRVDVAGAVEDAHRLTWERDDGRCACPRSDAQYCYRFRYGLDLLEMLGEPVDDDGRCVCVCHREDEEDDDAV